MSKRVVLDDRMLTNAEAAAMAGITPGSFRSEVSKTPMLQAGRVAIDARTFRYPRGLIQKWLDSRVGQGVRTDLGRTYSHTAQRERDATAS